MASAVDLSSPACLAEGGPRALFAEGWISPSFTAGGSPSAGPDGGDAPALELVDRLVSWGAQAAPEAVKHETEVKAAEAAARSKGGESSAENGRLGVTDLIKTLFDELVPGRFGMSIDDVKQGFADKIAAGEKLLHADPDCEQRLPLYQRLRSRFREQYQHVECVFEGIAQQKLLLFGESISESEIARIKECSAIQCLGTLSLLVDEFVRRTVEIKDAALDKVREALEAKEEAAGDAGDANPAANPRSLTGGGGKSSGPRRLSAGATGKRPRSSINVDKEGKKKRTRKNLSREARDVLTKWLNEHWSDPYPTQEEKVVLSQSAKITIEQVNNWFINARVRTWRPKVQAEYQSGRSHHDAPPPPTGIVSGNRSDPLSDLMAAAAERERRGDAGTSPHEQSHLGMAASHMAGSPSFAVPPRMRGGSPSAGTMEQQQYMDDLLQAQAHAQVERIRREHFANQDRRNDAARARGLPPSALGPGGRRRAIKPNDADFAFGSGGNGASPAASRRPPLHSQTAGKFGLAGAVSGYDLDGDMKDARNKALRQARGGMSAGGVDIGAAYGGAGSPFDASGLGFGPFGSGMPDYASGSPNMFTGSSPIMPEDYGNKSLMGNFTTTGPAGNADASQAEALLANKKAANRSGGSRISYPGQEDSTARRGLKSWVRSLDDHKNGATSTFDAMAALSGAAGSVQARNHAYSPFGIGDISPSLGLGLASPFNGLEGTLSPDGAMGFALGGFSPSHFNQGLFNNDHDDSKQQN